MVRIRPMKCPTPGLAPGHCSAGSGPHHDDNDTVEVFIAAQRLNCKETGRLPGGEAIQARSAVSAHQTQRQGPLGQREQQMQRLTQPMEVLLTSLGGGNSRQGGHRKGQRLVCSIPHRWAWAPPWGTEEWVGSTASGKLFSGAFLQGSGWLEGRVHPSQATSKPSPPPFWGSVVGAEQCSQRGSTWALKADCLCPLPAT